MNKTCSITKGFFYLHRCWFKGDFWNNSTIEQKLTLTYLVSMINFKAGKGYWKESEMSAPHLIHVPIGSRILKSEEIARRISKNCSLKKIRFALEKLGEYNFIEYQTMSGIGYKIDFIAWKYWQQLVDWNNELGGGYFLFHRNYFESEFWRHSTPEQKVCFLTLYASASISEQTIEWESSFKLLRPGQLKVTVKDIINMSGNCIKDYHCRSTLKSLERNNIISMESSKNKREGNLITFINWELEQGSQKH